MYHMRNRRADGSHHTPSLNTMAADALPCRSQGLSGLSTSRAADGSGRWNARWRVVSWMRKSSTNNCRPTSIGITSGGRWRYGADGGSRVKGSTGGHRAGRRIPLESSSPWGGWPAEAGNVHKRIRAASQANRMDAMPFMSRYAVRAG